MNAEFKVVKSDGTKSIIDLDKIHRMVEKACKGITGVSESSVEMNSGADQSDFVFTIVAPVQIIYPNGGEVLNAHDVFNLTYSTAPYVSAVKLDYSINGGISWSNIDTYQSGGSYDWTIPNIPSSQVLVRVQDQGITCIQHILRNIFV